MVVAVGQQVVDLDLVLAAIVVVLGDARRDGTGLEDESAHGLRIDGQYVIEVGSRCHGRFPDAASAVCGPPVPAPSTVATPMMRNWRGVNRFAAAGGRVSQAREPLRPPEWPRK